MKMPDQVCQNRVSVVEIDYHQRNRWKQYADDQNVLLHNLFATSDAKVNGK